MSAENVELARKALEQFIATGEPAWDVTHRDVEVHDHDIMDGEDYRGHAGVVRWLEDWSSAWSEFSMEPEQFIDAGERVVAVLRMRAKGRSSGLVLDRQDALVQELRDGMIVRIDYYNSRDQALEALGLLEAKSQEPTTSEPVEATRSVVQAFNRRDFRAVESLYAEDAVLAGSEIGEFDGAAAIRGLYEDMATPYGDVHGEIDEVIDLGDGLTFAIVIVVGHPIGSTSEVRFRYAATAVVADGVIARQTNSMDIDEARAAAERLAGERE